MDVFLFLFCILILYIIILFLIKKLGIGKKVINENCNNSCPSCKNPLNRIKRNSSDHIIHHLTFSVFDFRRYLCNECGWEGLRWEDKFRPELD